MREQQSLIGWIRHLRRVGASAEGATSTEVPQADRVGVLEARIEHLEKLIEGLQDSVHRETARQGRLIAELQEQVQPGAMGAALSKDARDRGL